MSNTPRPQNLACCLALSISLTAAGCDVLGLGDDCENADPVFTYMFTDLDMVRSIVPLGTPSTGGEIKERHQVQLLTETDASGVTSGLNVPLIAAATVRLDRVRFFRNLSPPAPFLDEYYGFELKYSCNITVRFDHIRSPGEKLRAAANGPTPNFEKPRRKTTFEAGEVIAHTDGTPPAPPGENRSFAFDYAMYDSRHENMFVNTDRYRRTGHLQISLHAICGGSYYTGTLRAAFDGKLGYFGNSAMGDCRSASRDVAGAMQGGWFRVGAATDADGWRLAIAPEVDGATRLAIHPNMSFFFYPIRATGRINLDPSLATGTGPYCYTDGFNEFWFQLSADGNRMSMAQTTGTCIRTTPPPFTVQWER